MRGQIIDSIYNLMETNKDIFFLTADMGINLVEKFGEKYPDRYANVGIAEQNLIGVAAGLANLGYRPFVYTISNFVIHRCFEQIRNDISLHRYPITLLGTSTGFDNSPLGPTHHIIDEWGSLKVLPGVDIYCPSSVSYSARIIPHVIEMNRPAYIRIPKGSLTTPSSAEHMVFMKGQSNDLLFVSYGNPAHICIEAQKQNPKISVLVINRLRPIDEEELVLILAPFKRIAVIEDHFAPSGLYGSLCEIINRKPIQARPLSLAPDNYSFDVGTSPDYYHRLYGFDLAALLKLAGK